MNDTETIRPPLDPAALYKALFLALIAAFVLVPLLATVLGGFKSLGELRVNPFGLPRQWEWQNYAEILFSLRYWQLLRNSLIISVLSAVLTLITASMAAFTFAHIKFFGSRMLLNYLTLGLLFPAATAVLPLFIKVRDLGLLDTYFGVALPQVAFSLAMTPSPSSTAGTPICCRSSCSTATSSIPGRSASWCIRANIQPNGR
jgi:raffinose/stachyose/melibiose transport system permease protein